MKRLYLFLLMIALTALSCCHSQRKVTTTTAPHADEAPLTKKSTLINAFAEIEDSTTWILQRMKGKNIQYAENQPRITLHFNTEAHLMNGHTGVNRYSSPYTSTTDATRKDQGTLRPKDIIATKIAGPNHLMTLEQTYLSLLSKVNRYYITEYELQLLQGDNVLLTFSKEDY